jgi:membrane associated rhomboid family serine protease
MTPTSVGMRCPECAREKTKVRNMRDISVPGTWSATNILIGINVIVFLAEVASGVTLGGNDSGTVFYHGALFGPAISGFNQYTLPAGIGGTHQYWRLLTSGFMHEGLIHIALNMMSLWFVGRSLEPAIGKKYFVGIYMASLFAGSFGSLLFEPMAATVGASAAIFGVFGALIMVAHARRIPLWQTGLIPILLFNLVFTASDSNISLGGHLGGLIAGLITGWMVTEWGERRRQHQWVYLGLLAVTVISIIGAIAVAGGGGLTPNGFTI